MDWNIFKSTASAGDTKSAEIAAKLREGIASGELAPGQRLAGATRLGRAFGCSGSPVEGARKRLVNEGLLVIRDGHYLVAGDAKPPTLADPIPAQTPLSQSLDNALDELVNGS